MASSKFFTPATLTTSSVLIDIAGVTDKRNLVYSSSSGKFVATVQAIPVGIVRMYASASAPTNYLICNGQAVNTFTYRFLHAVISNKYGGTAYNAGVTDQSGASTTFNLPNLIDYAFPYGSIANTSLPTTANIGGTTFDSSHTHNTTLNFSVDSGSFSHAHNISGNETGAGHTHNFGNSSANPGGHSHLGQSTSVQHAHNISLTNTSGSGNTGGISGNHTHNINNASASHNHSVNTSVTGNVNTHTHESSNDGGNHSSHNYSVTLAAATLSHSHTLSSATGVYFYIRFQ